MNVNFKSWRWVYYISGIPGFVVAILIVLTVRRPKPPEETSINYQTLNLQQEDSNASIFRTSFFINIVIPSSVELIVSNSHKLVPKFL